MAEGRIKGITIEIDGDVTGLNKALESTNKELRSSQKQLNDVNRLLKMDPTNTELLTQKQRLLGDTIKSTRDKLDTLKKAQEQAAAKLESGGKEAQEQYEALRREIISTENYLGKLEGQAEDTEKALNDAGNNGAGSIEEAGDSAKYAESKVSGFGSAAKAAGVAAAAAFAAAAAAAVSAAKALVDMTVGGAEYADEVLTLSTQTGIATDKLQEYMYAAELVDVSTETLTKSMAKNIKSMKSASDGSASYAEAYEQLGVAVVDTNGQLRDSEAVYWEAIDALGKIENETERDAIAMQLFGKSAQDLNPLIEAGASRMQELGKSAQEAGYVINDDMLNAYGALDDQLRYLDSGAKAAKNALGTVLLPVLTDIAGEGVDLLGEFTQGIIETNGDISKMSDVVGETLPKVIDAIMQFVPEFIEIAGELISSFASAIMKNLHKITDAAAKVIMTLTSVIISELPNVIGKLLPEIVNFGLELISGLGESLVKAIPALIDGLNEAFVGIIDTISDFLGIAGNAGDATEVLTDKQLENMEACKRNREEFQRLKDEFDNDASAIVGETHRTEELWKELQTLANQYGYVKDESKDRAEYILGELNDALGTEYEMNGNLIQQYDKMQDEIEGIIQKKQAAGLIELYGDQYNKALSDNQGYKDDYSAQKKVYNAAKDEYDKAKAEHDKAKEMYGGGKYSQVEYNRLMNSYKMNLDSAESALKTAENNLLAAEAALDENKSTIETYQSATEAFYNGEYTKVTNFLTRTASAVWDHVAEMGRATDEQKETLRLDLQSQEDYLNLYYDRMMDGHTGYTRKEFELLSKELDNSIKLWETVTGESYKIGENTVKSLAIGMLDNKEIVKLASKKTMSGAIEAMKNEAMIASPSKVTRGFGRNLVEGLTLGIGDGESLLEKASRRIMTVAINAMRTTAEIASPSKVTKKYGMYLDDGLIVGLEGGLGEVLDAVDKVSDSVLSRIALNPDDSEYEISESMDEWGAKTFSNYSSVYNNTTSLGGISVYVNAQNVDNVEDLADLVADRINQQIIDRQAVAQ